MNRLDDRPTVRRVSLRFDQLRVGDVVQNPGSGKLYEVTEVVTAPNGNIGIGLTGQQGIVSGLWWKPPFQSVQVEVLS